jgi:pilus assembly protein CpaE
MADKILIVDDDIDTVKFITIMLNRLGYETISALNGREALELAHKEHPDLIILDVMMPGIDGFEVTRSLRRHPETAIIPILMFTAKTQVDDKLTGYNAGVNIYLTKPIHPIELQANIKTLLAQKQARSEVAAEKGYIVGVLAAKGGLGVSTVALNLAIAYYQKFQGRVVAMECKPGQGSWAQELNLNNSSGLANLLQTDVTALTSQAVSDVLIPISHGIHLLVASNDQKDVSLSTSAGQYETILKELTQLATLVVLDIGTPFHLSYESLVAQCNEIILITEPQPTTVKHTTLLASELRQLGFGSARALTVVTVNRTRADMVLSVSQVEQMVSQPVALGIPPASELAFHAAGQYVPLIIAQPEGIVAQQFNNLADQVNQRLSTLLG